MIYNWELMVIKTKWSKKDIIEYFTSIINSILKKRRELGLGQEKAGSRLRIDQDFDYLKVYDLRKAKKSFKSIANLMWPGGSGDLEKKARRYYQKANDLINEPPIWKIIEENYKARQKAKSQ
jgi:hypothetical protein